MILAVEGLYLRGHLVQALSTASFVLPAAFVSLATLLVAPTLTMAAIAMLLDHTALAVAIPAYPNARHNPWADIDVLGQNRCRRQHER